MDILAATIGLGYRELYEFFSITSKWCQNCKHAMFKQTILRSIHRGYISEKTQRPGFADVFPDRCVFVRTASVLHLVVPRENKVCELTIDNERLSYAIGRSLSEEIFIYFIKADYDMDQSSFIHGVLSRDAVDHLRHFTFMGGDEPLDFEDEENWALLWSMMIRHDATKCIMEALTHKPRTEFASYLLAGDGENFDLGSFICLDSGTETWEFLHSVKPAMFTQEVVLKLLLVPNYRVARWVLTKNFPVSLMAPLGLVDIRFFADYIENRVPHTLEWLQVIWPLLSDMQKYYAYDTCVAHFISETKIKRKELALILSLLDTIPEPRWTDETVRSFVAMFDYCVDQDIVTYLVESRPDAVRAILTYVGTYKQVWPVESVAFLEGISAIPENHM